MRRHQLCGMLFVAWVTGTAFLPAQHLPLSPEALSAAEEIYTQAIAEGRQEWEAPAEGTAPPLNVEFDVPATIPSFLAFETWSNGQGRLTVHLGTRALPQDLVKAAPDKDWANPARRFDFRAVIQLTPNEWQPQFVSLNSEFFEAVSKQKLPYDLKGLAISTTGIEVNQPVPQGLKVRLRNLRILALPPAAQKADLTSKLDSLEKHLSLLKSESALRQCGDQEITALKARLAAFVEGDFAIGEWRNLSQEFERVRLAAGIWPLLEKCSEGYCVGTETSLKRVSGRHPNLIFRGQLSDQVEIQAAGNEFESFQIVLLPVGDTLKNVALSVESLRSEDGQHTIPADQVELFHQIEQFVQPSLGTATDWVGWIPDVLNPLTGTFTVPPGNTKAIWVTVHIPGKTPPGRYQGKIRIVPEDGRDKIVTVAVRVRPFEIPVTGRFRTQGHLSLEGLADWYGQNYSPEVRRNFYRLLLQHRMTPTSQYSASLSPAREDIPWIIENGGNVILIGGFSGRELDPEIIGPAYEWLVKNDLTSKAIIYIGDETNDFEGMKRKAGMIRRNWPELRIMIGGSKPREEIIGFMDVWDPITYGGEVYDFDPESTRQAIDRGEEVFWYTCVGPKMPFANVYNDHPLTAIRTLWWQAWKYGVTGFEYWWYNWWQPNLDLRDLSPPWPLSNPEAWNSRSFEWANGDGLLVYPGPKGTALSSIRLSVMRDAIEDWEVLFLLQRAVELAKKKGDTAFESQLARAQDLLEVPDSLTSDLQTWSDQPNTYWGARGELYDLLDGLVRSLGRESLEEYTLQWVKKHEEWTQERFVERVKQTPAD